MPAGRTGLTRDAGWQVGVRRTFPVTAEQAWDAVVSDRGLEALLGHGVALPVRAAGGEVIVAGEAVGRVASWADGRLLRVRLDGWEVAPDSTLQVRVLPAAAGATIAVHHERLAGPEDRGRMRRRWSTVVDVLGQAALTHRR